MLTIYLAVPGEVFPTRSRSTAHGISAEAGKVGAVLAQALPGQLATIGGTNVWLNYAMEIFAAFMLCGVFTVPLIPETKRRSLEELAGMYHGDDESTEIDSKEIADVAAISS